MARDPKRDALLSRIKDVKKSRDLFDNFGNDARDTFFVPRGKHSDESQPEPELIRPLSNAGGNEDALSQSKNKKGNNENTMQMIKPRKRSKQNNTFENISKQDVVKTITMAHRDFAEIDRIKKREEKRLLQELDFFEKKVEKFHMKAEKLASKNQFTLELENTIEIQDNYVAAMQEVNAHLKKINSDYPMEMSLSERRRQIYENSKLASTQRAQRLMYIRELEKAGKKLRKVPNDPSKRMSFYQSQLAEQNKITAFADARNPYYKKLQQVNEHGGVTVDLTMSEPDRIAQRWNETKNNYDKNGHIKIARNPFVDDESEK